MIKKIIIGVIVILILGSLFYWFQLRKSFAYKNCHNIAQDAASEKAGRDDRRYTASDYDFAYKRCLRMKGIK